MHVGVAPDVTLTVPVLGQVHAGELVVADGQAVEDGRRGVTDHEVG